MTVWDLPTRIYHWLQAVLFIGLIGTGFKGNGPHIYFGLALFSLLLWRVCWGVVGSDTSRFKNFIRSPKAVIDYLRGKNQHSIGHNPAGGWMVVFMLAMLLTQCITGLILADILTRAPFFSLLITDSIVDIAGIMHGISALLLLLMVAVHLIAILIYKLRSKPLVLAMITGVQKTIKQPNYSINIASNVKAIAILAGALIVTTVLVLSSS
ncbi:MAG: cytochrome b/b6 domain-containing protein [Psychrobium sp.]